MLPTKSSERSYFKLFDNLVLTFQHGIVPDLSDLYLFPCSYRNPTPSRQPKVIKVWKLMEFKTHNINRSAKK